MAYIIISFIYLITASLLCFCLLQGIYKGRSDRRGVKEGKAMGVKV